MGKNKGKRSLGPRALARKFLRVHEINNGDVILLKSKSLLAREVGVDAIAKAMNRTRRHDCVVVVVDSFDDLGVLNKDQMKELGWVYVGRPDSDATPDNQ